MAIHSRVDRLPQASANLGQTGSNDRAEAIALGLDHAARSATVPVQQLVYESTFLLALQAAAPSGPASPSPAGHRQRVAAVPQPRLLVTTPSICRPCSFLRHRPAGHRRCCRPFATAVDDAGRRRRNRAPERRCSKSTARPKGQLANRRTTEGAAWTLAGVRLEQTADDTLACAGHVEGRVALSDVIELLPDNRSCSTAATPT